MLNIEIHPHYIAQYKEDSCSKHWIYLNIITRFYFAMKKDSIEELFNHYNKNWISYIIYNSDGIELEIVDNKNYVLEEELESGK